MASCGKAERFEALSLSLSLSLSLETRTDWWSENSETKNLSTFVKFIVMKNAQNYIFNAYKNCINSKPCLDLNLWDRWTFSNPIHEAFIIKTKTFTKFHNILMK